jgi:hypothetical protein
MSLRSQQAMHLTILHLRNHSAYLKSGVEVSHEANRLRIQIITPLRNVLHCQERSLHQIWVYIEDVSAGTSRPHMCVERQQVLNRIYRGFCAPKMVSCLQ